MTGHVYILLSRKDQRTYVGSTVNIERRLNEHYSGLVRATKHRRPLVLIYFEEIATIEQARKREKYLKSAAGRRWLKENIFHTGGV